MFVRTFNRVQPGMLFRGGIDRLVSDLLDGANGSCGQCTFPPVNVWEDEQRIFIEAEVPGMKLDDLDLTVNGDEVTIKGERKQDETDGVSYHRQERGVGTFSRVVHLPTAVDVEKVAANLNAGVLTITLPKAQEVLPRKIKVNE